MITNFALICSNYGFKIFRPVTNHRIMIKDLPSDTRRNVLRAGIDVEEAVSHFRVLLAILRFKTHTDFYLRSEYENENRPRIRPRRHNTGASLIHPDIVSTEDFPIEESAILDSQYGRKDYRTSHQVGKGYVCVFHKALLYELFYLWPEKMPHDKLDIACTTLCPTCSFLHTFCFPIPAF